MTDQDKSKVVNVAGMCGGGLFFVLNLATRGKVPGGFVGGVIGYLTFALLAAVIVYVFVPKDEGPGPAPPMPDQTPLEPVSMPLASSSRCDGCGTDMGTPQYLEHVRGRGYLCYECRHRPV